MIRTEIQLRWNDMDMLGHLYNGKYQSLFDIGLSDYISSVMKIDYQNEVLEGGIWPLKASVTVNFISQVHFKHPLEVTTSIIEIGNKSMVFFQRLYRTDIMEVMADCRTVMVSYDVKNHISVPVPQNWRSIALEDGATDKYAQKSNEISAV